MGKDAAFLRGSIAPSYKKEKAGRPGSLVFLIGKTAKLNLPMGVVYNINEKAGTIPPPMKKSLNSLDVLKIAR